MKITTVSNDPLKRGMCTLEKDVVYSAPDGEELHADLIRPRSGVSEEDTRKYPALLFIQGSGWTHPKRNGQIPQLSLLAHKGVVVMTVDHRSRAEGHPAPAFLQDIKCALRFLRANAEKYHVDPERIAVWGTSSGGNAALMTALTPNVPEFETEDYPGEDEHVVCCVDCFGPTDVLLEFRERAEARGEAFPNAKALMFAGEGNDVEKALTGISPMHWISRATDTPPMLILHGDSDPTVDFDHQSVRFAEAYEAAGHEVEFVRVTNAEHEGTFWSGEVLALIFDFLERKLIGR